MTAIDIQKLWEQKPFRPFSFRSVSGDQFIVQESWQLAMPKSRPEILFFFDQQGDYHIIELEKIESVNSR
jgi:hypothetical protein